MHLSYGRLLFYSRRDSSDSLLLMTLACFPLLVYLTTALVRALVSASVSQWSALQLRRAGARKFNWALSLVLYFHCS